jgi:hypothetical protein
MYQKPNREVDLVVSILLLLMLTQVLKSKVYLK